MKKKTIAVHGILLLDKRCGVSSNRALQEIKRLYNATKAGHSGSLDPMATGLLPLCFGEATKVASMMLGDNKCYQVQVQLGATTDTGDREGKITSQQPPPNFSKEQVLECLNKFIGPSEQIPPMYCALKQQGKKLYQLARAGIVVDRKPRPITIFALQLTAVERTTISFDVSCSKGTYIRSLAEDIGTELGCGAYVLNLRRTKVGQFCLDDSFTVECLEAMDQAQLGECLLPVDKPLEAMPSIELSALDAQAVKLGKQINTPDHNDKGMIRMYSEQIFVGLGELHHCKLAPKKIFNLTQ